MIKIRNLRKEDVNQVYEMGMKIPFPSSEIPNFWSKESLYRWVNKGITYICCLIRVDDEETKKFLKKEKFERWYNFTWMERTL